MNSRLKNMISKNYKIKDEIYLNQETFYDYLLRLERLSRSIFEWKLPHSMNSEFLEKILYYYGESTFLNDENYGFINTKCSRSGGLNIYDLPTQFLCYSHNYNKTRKLYVGNTPISDEYNECILVRNNWDSLPTADTIYLFAKRLSDCDRTCDLNLAGQKTPWIVLIDEKQRLSVENFFNKVETNQRLILANKGNLNPDNFKSIDITTPYVIDKIQDYKRQIWNECLTFLGINNLQDEKKERLIESEINSNNELINLNLQSFFAPRQQACKQFNEKFGLTGENAISVKLRSDLHNVIKETESIVLNKKETNKDEEVENNE